MNLKDKLERDIKKALKAGKKQKLTVLRFLNSQIKNQEIKQDRKSLSDEQIVRLISKEVKKLRESLDLFKKANRQELVKKTKQEIDILSAYLPEQLSDEQLKEAVEKIIGDNREASSSGALIGRCVKELGSRADNAKIAQLVRKKLNQ